MAPRAEADGSDAALEVELSCVAVHLPEAGRQPAAGRPRRCRPKKAGGELARKGKSRTAPPAVQSALREHASFTERRPTPSYECTCQRRQARGRAAVSSCTAALPAALAAGATLPVSSSRAARCS